MSIKINKRPKEDSKNNSVYNAPKKEKRIKYKGIKIPKLLLNRNILDLNNEKKYYYYIHKTKNRISSENYIFLKRQRKDELTNYYFTKNKKIINEISLNSKRKLNNISTLEKSKLNQSEIKKIKILKNPIKFRIFQMNQDNSHLNEIDKMNTSFLSSKIDDPFLDIKIKKYLKEKQKERNNLCALVNNPFIKKSNGINKLYPLFDRKILIERLLKPNKIKTEVYDSIFQEYKNAKLKLDNSQILEKKLLRSKIYKNKEKNDLLSKKFINNSGETQKRLLDEQINLIKRKMDNNFYKYETNFEYLNDFETNLFLSLSNTKDQIYNIKAIPKLINDSSVIKDLVEEVFINTNKK